MVEARFRAPLRVLFWSAAACLPQAGLTPPFFAEACFRASPWYLAVVAGHQTGSLECGG